MTINWSLSLAVGVYGQGQAINDAFGTLSPLATDANQLVSILLSQQSAVQKLVSNTGEVFTALSERDGQLSSLISNANQVFQTTANRNAELQQTFVVLPTFEKESQLTLKALTAFALNTNPLVTQLRPAARQLSPLLIDTAKLAPSLKTFFVQLNPLITSSRTGLPALRDFLRELPPVLGQIAPFVGQINPILSGLGFYKDELNAFFSNTVAATNAGEPNPNGKGLLHYLRTTNPVNPENLAVQSHRLARTSSRARSATSRAACPCTRTGSAAGPTSSSRCCPRQSASSSPRSSTSSSTSSSSGAFRPARRSRPRRATSRARSPHRARCPPASPRTRTTRTCGLQRRRRSQPAYPCPRAGSLTA